MFMVWGGINEVYREDHNVNNNGKLGLPALPATQGLLQKRPLAASAPEGGAAGLPRVHVPSFQLWGITREST